MHCLLILPPFFVSCTTIEIGSKEAVSLPEKGRGNWETPTATSSHFLEEREACYLISIVPAQGGTEVATNNWGIISKNNNDCVIWSSLY